MGEIAQKAKSLHCKEEHNRDIKKALLGHRKKLVPAEWRRGRRTGYLGCNSKGQLSTEEWRVLREMCESVPGKAAVPARNLLIFFQLL